MTEFCRAHGVSTWFFYDLRRRFGLEGEAVLEPRSRAPKRVANRTPAEVEDRIVEVRKRLEDDGLDAGPATIAYHLGEGSPSEATIWRVLRRRGFVVPQPRKAPRSAYRSFTAERANECWQIDDTTWSLADGSEVKIINVIDDCTRVAVACRAVPSCTGEAAVAAMVHAADGWGLPERFLSDNALVFRHHLTHTMAALGVGAGHSRPHHPQTCGKVERFHQTEQRFLNKQPTAETIDELQAQLDVFAAIYNHQRPHRALHRRIPAEVWHTTPRSGPAAASITAPTRVTRSTVSKLGHTFPRPPLPHQHRQPLRRQDRHHDRHRARLPCLHRRPPRPSTHPQPRPT